MFRSAMENVDFRQLCIEWGLETARFMSIADISSGGVTSKSDEIYKLATDAVDVLMNSAPKEYSVEGCIRKQFESDVYIEEPSPRRRSEFPRRYVQRTAVLCHDQTTVHVRHHRRRSR